MRQKSLGINALLNGMRSLLNLLFPLITFPYVSRILQVDGMGKYNFSNSLISYFLMIAALGINNYAVREGAKIRNDRDKFSSFASQIFTINIVSTLFSYFLLGIIMVIFREKLHSYNWLIILFSIQIIFTTIGMEWIYTIYEEYTYITIRSIIFKIISLILIYLYVKEKNDVTNYVLITVFATIGSNIFNFLNIRKFCDITVVKNMALRKHLKPIMIIFATGIATQIYVNSDITLLGILKNDYVVGIYSVSSKIYNIVKSVVQAIVIVTVPRISMYLGQGNTKKFNELFNKVLNILAMLTLPVTVGLYALAPEIINIISGPSFISGVSSLRILCPALLISVFSWIFAYCILLPAKLENKFLEAAVISAGLNICLNFIMIPYLSEVGAAITTTIAEVVMFIFIFISCKDIFKNYEIIKKIMQYIIGSIFVFIICNIISNNLKNPFYIIMISGIISAFVYSLVLIIFKNDEYIEMLKKLKMRNNNEKI